MHSYIHRSHLPPWRFEDSQRILGEAWILVWKTRWALGTPPKIELVALHPSNFKIVEKFFTKFKSLALQCIQCRIERKDEKNVLSILKKLGPEYSLFFSIFHSKNDSFLNWKIPSLDSFSESLIKEQEKLIRMGVIKTSKYQALLVTYSSKAQAKGKSKKKEPKETNLKPK